MLPTSFKELFLKATDDIFIIQDMQPTKHYVIQVSTNAEKKFLIEKLPFGQMYNCSSKINPITPLASNTDHF